MKYWGPLKIKFKERFSSRAMLAFWVLSKPIAIFVAVTAWTAVYNYTGEGTIKGFTLNQTLGYMMFSTILGAIRYNNIGRHLGKDIQAGRLNTKLVRPVDYGLLQLSLSIGDRLHAVLFEVLPGVVIAWLFFGFQQFNPAMTILSLLSISLALLVSYFLNITWALMYFKTIEYGRMEWLKDLFFMLFAGVIIPLNFLPNAFQEVLKYLPFQFITYIPARIFINSYAIGETIVLIAIQATWIVLLYSLYRVGWHYAIKNYSGVDT